jgi:hypothetical protein
VRGENVERNSPHAEPAHLHEAGYTDMSVDMRRFHGSVLDEPHLAQPHRFLKPLPALILHNLGKSAVSFFPTRIDSSDLDFLLVLVLVHSRSLGTSKVL